jgi:maleamate amidohydrolase
MSTAWDGLVPRQELERLAASGYGGQDVTLGERPCLIVIDVVMSFLGRRPGDTKSPEYITGCGEAGWKSLPSIVRILDAARDAGVERVFSKGSPEAAAMIGGAIKLSSDPDMARTTHSAPFPAELQPAGDEFVVEKTKASAFFGTPLLTFLHQRRVDSLLMVGTTTSGCVRASVVDAASHGYPVVVAADACFDRSDFAHAANLFDIQMKYGSVVSSDDAIALLKSRRATR